MQKILFLTIIIFALLFGDTELSGMKRARLPKIKEKNNKKKYLPEKINFKKDKSWLSYKEYIVKKKCVINGNDNELWIYGGQIIIERGATLHLKNIKLSEFQNKKPIFVLASYSSKIIFENVEWSMEKDYEIKKGQLTVANNSKLVLKSMPIFMVESCPCFTIKVKSPIKILSQSKLIIDRIIFGYLPSNNNPNLIEQKATSSLTLKDSVLYFKDLTLKNGTLFLKGKVDFWGVKRSSKLKVKNTFIVTEPNTKLTRVQGVVRFSKKSRYRVTWDPKKSLTPDLEKFPYNIPKEFFEQEPTIYSI